MTKIVAAGIIRARRMAHVDYSPTIIPSAVPFTLTPKAETALATRVVSLRF